jgi:hypothetical protein
MFRTIFILTTYITNQHQSELLAASIDSIRAHHPDASIQVLDDDHSKPECVAVPLYCKIEKTKHSRCGEVNAYIWAIEHKTEYDIFIYIHDSCKIRSPIPYLLKGRHFRQFWFTSRSSNNDTRGEEIDAFMNIFTVYRQDCKEELELVRGGKENIIFGTMAAFDRDFLTFLETQTNFIACAPLLNGRSMRCFFERLLYIIVKKFTGGREFVANAYCGDIFKHTDAFNNSSFAIKPNNPYLIKVWQSR